MTPKITISAAAGFMIAASAAQAAPLSIVEVEAPAISCVFNAANEPRCAITARDSVATFTLPGDSGDARLQARTYLGQTSAPASGAMGYEYRVDLTKVRQKTAKNCVAKLALKFGPVVRLPYSPKGDFDVFVVTKGGLGSVALASADQVGEVITFTFSEPICPGATSYFFGLASKGITPVAGKTDVFFSLGNSRTIPNRIPCEARTCEDEKRRAEQQEAAVIKCAAPCQESFKTCMARGASQKRTAVDACLNAYNKCTSRCEAKE